MKYAKEIVSVVIVFMVCITLIICTSIAGSAIKEAAYAHGSALGNGIGSGINMGLTNLASLSNDQ